MKFLQRYFPDRPCIIGISKNPSGVPLGIPFINRIVGKARAMAAGCQAPAAQRIGTLNLGTPPAGTADPGACAAYNAADLQGRPDPRIPGSLALTVRMQTPARAAGNKTGAGSTLIGDQGNPGGLDDPAPRRFFSGN